MIYHAFQLRLDVMMMSNMFAKMFSKSSVLYQLYVENRKEAEVNYSVQT